MGTLQAPTYKVNTTGSTREGRQPRSRAVQIGATENEDNSSVSSHGEQGERGHDAAQTLSHLETDFKSKLLKFSGSHEQWYTWRCEFELLPSINNMMHVFKRSYHIKASPMDIRSLIRPGRKMEEIKEAGVAFLQSSTRCKKKDLKSMLLESRLPSLARKSLSD